MRVHKYIISLAILLFNTVPFAKSLKKFVLPLHNKYIYELKTIFFLRLPGNHEKIAENCKLGLGEKNPTTTTTAH
jgi:hypothetical protein